MTTEKITELEVIIEHQGRELGDLSDMVNKQWQEIELLKKMLKQTRNRMKIMEDSSRSDSGDSNLTLSDMLSDDKPPHY